MHAAAACACVRACARIYTYARPYYVRTAAVATTAAVIVVVVAAVAVHSCGAPASVFVARSARSKYPYAGDACVRACAINGGRDECT